MDKINIRFEDVSSWNILVLVTLRFRSNENSVYIFFGLYRLDKNCRKLETSSARILCTPEHSAQLLICRVNNVKLHRRQTRSKELESGRKRAWRVFALSCGTLVRVYIVHMFQPLWTRADQWRFVCWFNYLTLTTCSVTIAQLQIPCRIWTGCREMRCRMVTRIDAKFAFRTV